MTKIRDWNDADEVLGRLAQLHRDVAVAGTWRDQAIQKAKDEHAHRVKPLVEEIEQREAELHRFVLEHQEDLEGRSRKLERGRCGLLLVKALHVRNIKRAVAWLLDAKKLQFLHVKHELHKEALRDAPADVLKACGVKVRDRDQFWYEVDGTRHAVED